MALALLASPVGALGAQETELRTLAEQGDTAAQIRLGYGFRDGTFGPVDYAQAYRWFSRAAESGNPEAVDNLAWLIEHGQGAAVDFAKARSLYRRAAEQKHPPAMNNLARCLGQGIGGPVDPAEALHWSLETWKAWPDDKAGAVLATTLRLQPSLTAHAETLKKLAGSNHYAVVLQVGRIYAEGRAGIEKDADLAQALFSNLHQLGLPPEILDPLQVAALARRPAVKGRFAYLSTPHLDQGYNLCAPTSAAMALEYQLGRAFDPLAIKQASTGATELGTGTAWDCMLTGIRAVSGKTWTFRSFPLNAAGFDAGLPVLLGELDAGRVALIDLGPHTVVLCGYDAPAQRVYINNPAQEWPGLETVSYEQLRERWHSPWHLTTTRGVEARPVLLTGERSPAPQQE